MEKCIVMLSNGLDSRVVVKLMQEKYEVIAVHNRYPFSKNAVEKVKKFCKEQGVELKIFDFRKGGLLKKYLEVLKKPKHGRGTALNHCIDCRILGLEIAKKFADSEGIKLIATGEVLGQRPMSQHAKALKIVEEESGLKGRLVRPLTEMKIHGRRRTRQMGLAKKFGIEYPGVGGGCLLCEKEYCKKLKKVLGKELNFEDIELLQIGRHFEDSKIILGRDSEENKMLEKFSGLKIIPKQPGPTALVKNKELIEKAKKLIGKHSKHEIKDFEVRNK